MTRIPGDVRDALIARNEEREVLKRREAELDQTPRPLVGDTFSVEGVPVKVCDGPTGPYLRRLVGREKARELRESWRTE